MPEQLLRHFCARANQLFPTGNCQLPTALCSSSASRYSESVLTVSPGIRPKDKQHQSGKVTQEGQEEQDGIWTLSLDSFCYYLPKELKGNQEKFRWAAIREIGQKEHFKSKDYSRNARKAFQRFVNQSEGKWHLYLSKEEILSEAF